MPECTLESWGQAGDRFSSRVPAIRPLLGPGGSRMDGLWKPGHYCCPTLECHRAALNVRELGTPTLFLFFGRVSLDSSVSPGTYSVDQAHRDPSATAS